MRQEEVAAHLNVSVQLIQKYETGLIRIGAGRMSAIASVLGVSAAFFYGSEQSNVIAASLAEEPKLIAFLATPEAMTLNTAFQRISDRRVRRHLLALILATASHQP